MENNQHTPRNPRRRTPQQRDRRLQGQLLSRLLIGCIVLFLVLSLVIKDKEFSPSENRKLAQFPKFSFSALVDGSYFAGLDDYIADQFPGRDTWISVSLGMNRLLGQKEASGVYLCDEDFLIQIPAEPNEAQVERNLAAVNDFAAAHPDVNMYMTIVPNAVTIYSAYLPANAPARDQGKDLDMIQAQLGEGVAFLDVTDTLLEHNDELLFYRTDHHWTTLGAYYAFEYIAPSLGIEPPAQSTYTVYTLSNTFEGTLASKSGSHAVTDTVQIMVPETEIEYYVTYPDGSPNICSMYVREALDQKDHYTVFFGGNYSRVDITTTANTGRCLLIFKDSYANCFIQFLYPYFDHITMIDPRYYYDNVDNVLRSEGITDVLFLYNADTFLSDSSLADVLTAGN